MASKKEKKKKIESDSDTETSSDSEDEKEETKLKLDDEDKKELTSIIEGKYTKEKILSTFSQITKKIQMKKIELPETQKILKKMEYKDEIGEIKIYLEDRIPENFCDGSGSCCSGSEILNLSLMYKKENYNIEIEFLYNAHESSHCGGVEQIEIEEVKIKDKVVIKKIMEKFSFEFIEMINEILEKHSIYGNMLEKFIEYADHKVICPSKKIIEAYKR